MNDDDAPEEELKSEPETAHTAGAKSMTTGHALSLGGLSSTTAPTGRKRTRA